jgi:hypothetical protein
MVYLDRWTITNAKASGNEKEEEKTMKKSLYLSQYHRPVE